MLVVGGGFRRFISAMIELADGVLVDFVVDFI